MAGDDNMSAATASPEAEQRLADLMKLLLDHADELQSLAQQLIELKQSGVLDALMIVINRFEEVIHYLFQDPAIFRTLSLALDGTLGAMAKVETQDVITAKAALQELLVRVVKNLKPELITTAKPVGFWGLLGALSDPEVQRGLGIAIALLKALGKQ